MLKGLGGLGDMAKIMKQAQNMQAKDGRDAGKASPRSRSRASPARGLVKATATAKGELIGLDIDPSIFNQDDRKWSRI